MLPPAPMVVERRRAPRIHPGSLVALRLIVRRSEEISPVVVRDLSFVGMGIVAARPIPVALGERILGLFTFFGTHAHDPVRGSIVELRVRRRQPDAEGWLIGVEFADLRESRWRGLVAWIEGGGGTPAPYIALPDSYSLF